MVKLENPFELICYLVESLVTSLQLCSDQILLSESVKFYISIIRHLDYTTVHLLRFIKTFLI